jgi:iron complex outermembrane receptor protein
MEAVEVDALIVTARPNSDDPPAVAEARRSLSETPGAVTVVAAESYQDRYAQTLAESLRDAPGVFAQKRYGEDIRLSIRGSGLGNAVHNRGVLLARDGVPYNEADGFGDFQLIDPATARFTEVYKGGNALRFGGALLGGAVNIVTPTGRDAVAPNRLRLDGGAYRTVRGHAETARAGEDWDLFAAATALSVNGWRDQSDQTAQHLTLSLGRRFGEDREARLILSAHNSDQEIPGALTLAEALTTPKRTTPASLALEYQRNVRSLRATLQTRWRLGAQTVLTGAVYGGWKDLDHPLFQVIDQESRNFGGFARLDWEGALGGRKADLFAGLWLRRGDLDANQWVNLKGSRGARTAASAQNATAADAFAEGRLFVTDRLALIAGASAGWTDRDYRNLLDRALSRTVEFEWLAPRLGVLWEAEDGAQVFANLTRSVEPPNFSALAQTVSGGGFVQLAPQEAWTAEAGTRGRRGPFTWDLAIYRAELKHELLNFIIGPDIPAATFNAGPTIHRGFEAGLDWRLAARWRLRQTYAWSDFRFDGDRIYGDNRLPVAPEHHYRAELRYDHPAGWFVAPSVAWVPGDTFVDYANTLKAPGYAVWSLNAGWTIRDGLSAFVEARNLADERYVSNFAAVTDARRASTAVFHPGEGRALFGGLAWDF